MKRSICWILAALFLLAVAACGSNAAEGPVTDAAHSPAPKETQDDVVAVVVTPPPTQEATLPPAPTLPPELIPTPEPTEVPIGDPIITLVEGEELNVAADFTFSDPGYFAADYRGQGADGEGLDVRAVGHFRIGHDRRRIRVDEHDFESFPSEGLHRLAAGIVEFAALSDYYRTRPYDQDLLDVRALHIIGT